jgi:CheY-like chemotaxis protein
VEDDDLLRHLAVATLSMSGYRVIEAASGQEALRAVAEHDAPLHLLITDIIMPQMTGTELAARFVKLVPNAPVLYISGYAGDAPPGAAGQVLQKPFTNEELLERVRRLLDAAGQAGDGDERAAGA